MASFHRNPQMSDYLIKATYTPDDPDFDRRHSFVIKSKTGIMGAIDEALLGNSNK